MAAKDNIQDQLIKNSWKEEFKAQSPELLIVFCRLKNLEFFIKE